MIRSHRSIAWNYLKGWCSIDLLTLFPFQILLSGDGKGNGTKLLRMARLTRLTRMLKLLKLLRLLKLPDMLSLFDAQSLFNVIKTFQKDNELNEESKRSQQYMLYFFKF